MRIVVLSRSESFSTRRLREEAERRGHGVRVLDVSALSMTVIAGVPLVLHRGKPLQRIGAVVPRIGASVTFTGAAIIRQFEQMGVYCAVGSEALVLSRDKLRSLQRLVHHVAMPPTAFVQRRAAIAPVVERLGGFPVVVKVLEGTQGEGVILAENAMVLEAIVGTLSRLGQPVLVQKYIEESRGRDVRVFVVGGRVVAAVRRVGAEGEYRSNVHRGGRAEPLDLDDAYAEVAVKAARVLGLEIAGIDLLESDAGPLLMEVNSSPGIQGMEKATGVDIAGAVIEHVTASTD